MVLAVLAISIFVLTVPFSAGARTFTYYQPAPFTDSGNNNTYDNNGDNYSSQNNYNSYQNNYGENIVSNPVPYITSITPNSVTAKAQIIKVTVNGSGFVQGSSVNWDNSPRTTTYINQTRLIVQLNESDVVGTGRHYITVINSAPGGGFSNPVPFSVNKAIVVSPSTTRNTTTTTNTTSSSSYGASASTAYDSAFYNSNSDYSSSGDPVNYGSLTSNAVYGSDNFLPTGLFQWILFIILILVIIFIWRRFFGNTLRYHSTPLKHA